MKKLGLIGGLGPESTVVYYQEIVYGVQKRIGRPIFPQLTIESLSSFEVIQMSSEGKTADLTDYLLSGIQKLVAAGADFGALACNTGHMVFKELQSQSPIPLISIVDVTCHEAKRQGFTRVGLLGTAATMNGFFFKQPFLQAGIDVEIPEKEEKEWIAQRISEELELGIINPQTAAALVEIVERMVEDKHIEAVVLGCTELPLLLKDAKLPVPCLDTMNLHIQALIEGILSD